MFVRPKLKSRKNYKQESNNSILYIYSILICFSYEHSYL